MDEAAGLPLDVVAYSAPPRTTRGQRRRRKEASHGPYWHRRAQEGQPDLHPRRRGWVLSAAHPPRARAFRRRARDPALRPNCDRGLDRQRIEWVARCLEAFGHEVIVADPNFAPMYATRRAHKVKTDRRDARALAEACLLGAYRPAHRLSDPQGPCGAGCWSGTQWSDRARAISRSSGPCSGSTATAPRPAVRRALSIASGALPCPAACSRWSRR